jgi:hypothetical protein
MQDHDRFRSEKVEAVERRGLHLVVAWRRPAVKAECLRGTEQPEAPAGGRLGTSAPLAGASYI